MLPNAVAGIVAVDGIVVVDGVVVAGLPVMGVETVLGTVDVIGAGDAVREGGGGAGGVGGGGAGTVEPGKVDKNDVAGCADSASVGAVVLPDTEDIVGAAETDGVVPVVPPVADTEVTGTAGVTGVICPDGLAQVTTVPGVVGSEASGTGASVVSGTPGWVAAENGLGPLSGEDRTVPGVDGRPMAVLPIVETCARQTWAPNSRVTVVNSKCRIAMASPSTV
jgi:hypothetical protein